MKKLFFVYIFIMFTITYVFGQSNEPQIHGSFQMDAFLYQEDSTIGTTEVPEELGMNAFLKLLYKQGNFEAGVRYESFLNPIQGYDSRYKGSGFANRYIKFTKDDIEITAGNFYEQFGSGLVLRSYEDWTLGYDNSIDGIRVKYKPYKGVVLKGLIGNHRFFWDKGDGIIRGFDGEVSLNEAFTKMNEAKTRVLLGGSFVSKYQADQDPIYKLPENVCAGSARLTLSRGNVFLKGEYAHKVNDPSAVNNFIYKEGNALFVQGNYSKKGFGVVLSAKRIDNMNFRSDRTITGWPLSINYLPASTKTHSYALTSIYPYATQPNGEFGFQGNIIYTLKKGSKLGGKYGTTINFTYSAVKAIDMQVPDDTANIFERGTLGYKSDFFTLGDRKYYEEFNLEITRKFSKKVKGIFYYLNQVYDIETIEGHVGEPTVYANTFVADVTYKFKPRKALRFEAQHLSTKQNDGNWAFGMVEYTTKNWFFALMDQYNYGNEIKDEQIHYYTGSLGYNKNTSRIALSYGKQREGILCVGGVCRVVPAAYGFMLTITTSF